MQAFFTHEFERRRYAISKAWTAYNRGDNIPYGSESYTIIQEAFRRIENSLSSHFREEFNEGKRLMPYWIHSPRLAVLRAKYKFSFFGDVVDEGVRRQTEIETWPRKLTGVDKVALALKCALIWSPEFMKHNTLKNFPKFLTDKPYMLGHANRYYNVSGHGFELLEEIELYRCYLDWFNNGKNETSEHPFGRSLNSATVAAYIPIVFQEAIWLNLTGADYSYSAVTKVDNLPFELRPRYQSGLELKNFKQFIAPRVAAERAGDPRNRLPAHLLWQTLILDYRQYLSRYGSDPTLKEFDALNDRTTELHRGKLLQLFRYNFGDEEDCDS